MGHFIPHFIAHAAHFGYDCIWLDLEHRAMEYREVQALLAFFHKFDIDCMLRTPTREKTRLYRFLEDGATGLLVPLVNTAEEARALVQSVKFPPIGDRGLDGAGLDGNFYIHGGENYVAHANRETFLVVQIESPQAVANADAIAAVAGIDGLFIGPADLDLRIKQTPGAPSVEESADIVARAAAKHGKAWGQPAVSEEQLGWLHRKGGRLLMHGSDFGAIFDMLRSYEERFTRATGE